MADFTFNKRVPVDRKPVYRNLGWTVDSGSDTISRTLQTPGQRDDRIFSDCTITSSVCLHNGLIKRPFGLYDYHPLDRSVLFSDTGMTVQEVQRRQSLWRMWAQAPLYQSVEVDQFAVDIGGRPHLLWLYANFDSQEIKKAYLSVLADFFTGVRVTGGPLEIRRIGTKLALDPSADFWWDTQNDVMFSFDKQFIFRLPNHLQASFQSLMEDDRAE